MKPFGGYDWTRGFFPTRVLSARQLADRLILQGSPVTELVPNCTDLVSTQQEPGTKAIEVNTHSDELELHAYMHALKDGVRLPQGSHTMQAG